MVSGASRLSLAVRRELRLSSRFGTVLLMGSSLVTGAAFADSAAVATTADSTNEIQEITVTAQRREERLQDVPISITALTAADLDRSHIEDASRLEFVTPGLTWGQQGSDSFPAIRGARTSLVSAQNDPIIGYYIDGIYQSRTQQQSIPLFDISRVEVQRGPRVRSMGATPSAATSAS